MPKLSREHVTTNGRAAFYACIWPEIKKAATEKGWALGLHGSLSNDMDFMAMPWDEQASSVEDLIVAISDCFVGVRQKEEHLKPFLGKPHGRIVYTIHIWADFYIDISVMDSRISK